MLQGDTSSKELVERLILALALLTSLIKSAEYLKRTLRHLQRLLKQACRGCIGSWSRASLRQLTPEPGIAGEVPHEQQPVIPIEQLSSTLCLAFGEPPLARHFSTVVL